MNLIGKTTIHPWLFYSGKIVGYIIWVLYFLLFVFNLEFAQSNHILKLLSLFVSAIGLLITILSLINLGRSTRLGLPVESTHFITIGLYRFSRNPMYLGFDLLTLSALIYFWNPWITLAGIYSILVYHFIILGEERFLEKRFGDEYLTYRKKVRRYI